MNVNKRKRGEIMNYIWEAKDFLKHFREYENADKNLNDKLKKLNTELEGYKPINYSDMPHGSSETTDDQLCNMIFERDFTKECLMSNKNKINECKQILNNLNEEYKKILILSCIDELPETEIMQKLNISRANYFRKKNEALRTLAKNLFGIKVSGY